jgi:hypothetical protein
MSAVVPLVCLLLGVRAGEPLHRPIALPAISVGVEHGPPLRVRPPAELPEALPLRQIAEAFRRCYAQALKTNPTAEGRLRCMAEALRRVRLATHASFTAVVPLSLQPSAR